MVAVVIDNYICMKVNDTTSAIKELKSGVEKITAPIRTLYVPESLDLSVLSNFIDMNNVRVTARIKFTSISGYTPTEGAKIVNLVHQFHSCKSAMKLMFVNTDHKLSRHFINERLKEGIVLVDTKTGDLDETVRRFYKHMPAIKIGDKIF